MQVVNQLDVDEFRVQSVILCFVGVFNFCISAKDFICNDGWPLKTVQNESFSV